MVADRNGFGVTGISYQANIGLSSVATQSVEGALYSATSISNPGDLILIELHTPGPHYDFAVRTDQAGYVAMEYFQTIFDAIVNAYAHGVIVCEAAGNGNENFDDTTIYGSLFQRSYRNSHAIICGAGYPPIPGILTVTDSASPTMGRVLTCRAMVFKSTRPDMATCTTADPKTPGTPPASAGRHPHRRS